MSKMFIRFLSVVLGLFVAAKLVPGITLGGLQDALIVAVILSILNMLVRPVLLILTLPITIVSLGLFIFILNALLFSFVGGLVTGFEIDTFGSALIGSIIVSIISWFVQKLT